MATRPRYDYFVTRSPDPTPPDPPPTVAPSCTCFLASGTEVVNKATGERRPAQGARDAKGRPVCQVHFPVTQEEFLGRAVGDCDDYSRL